MEIDEHAVPGAVVDAFCGIADELAPAVIVAKGSETLFQGHRVLPQNVPVAVKRLKTALKSNRLLDPANRTLLQSGGLFKKLVLVLSEEALEAGFSDLAIYFGEAEFLAAALLDDREAVRMLAHDFIAGWDGQWSDDTQRENAAAGLRSTFASFLSNIHGLLDEALPPISRLDKDKGVADRGNLERALNAAKADVARLTRHSEKERKAFQDKIIQIQKEIDRLRRESTAARNESESCEIAYSKVQKDLAALQATLQQRIDEGVSKTMSDRLRQWIEPVRNVEDAVKAAQQSDLLGRAAEALERQRSVDFHFGNRAALTQMIEQRRQILREVQRAQIDALSPLSELAEIAAELESEICELNRRLGQSAEQLTATVAGLLARINAAPSLDRLYGVRQFVQQAAAYDLLNRDELNRLYCATDNKAALLYDKAEILDKDLTGSPKRRFFLRHAVAHGQPFTLYIDGHNVLYTLKDIFGRHFVDGHPKAKSRVEFGKLLVRVFNKLGADVMLFFDGDDPAEQSISDQVRVIYSGGTGEHRADEAILKHLSFSSRSAPSATRCLVTKDADLARQASAKGAIIVHPEEFATSLDVAAE